ncbi:uncharacterized protein TM35_000022240 [Trypanosoma theileri]|uniref:Uncharacterized protein n=1 Tax=Trypanosoma theileri TaxID=67003 RepID=A0A1X0P7P4_9TRYP|nr:uncharacterized protein TM35_000022240 [Trypanosoma theileri]ORC92898.1 hypothetical protein TM35_000022240 [Trypanosoma theileri]
MESHADPHRNPTTRRPRKGKTRHKGGRHGKPRFPSQLTPRAARTPFRIPSLPIFPAASPRTENNPAKNRGVENQRTGKRVFLVFFRIGPKSWGQPPPRPVQKEPWHITTEAPGKKTNAGSAANWQKN